jgi:phosphoglycolate phosphatase-like HAD superfamily hydrolase
MTDRLQIIWEVQAKQQSALGIAPEQLNAAEKQELAGKMILGVNEETVALQQLMTRYKRHILREPDIIAENVSDKVADLIKYAVCLAQLHGVTPEQIVESFHRKTAVVYDKARGERLRHYLKRDSKVIAVDLDDVVCDLSPWTEKLKELRGDAPMNERTLTMVESYKDEFYRRGRFASLAPVNGAAASLRQLSKQGYYIVVITARPQWQYPRLYADTLQWLERHQIPHDLLLFNKDKAEAVFQHIRPAWPLFFVEDHARNALALSAIGVDVLLFDRPHNRHIIMENAHIKRVIGWDGVMAELNDRLQAQDDDDSQADMASSLRA